MASKQMPDQLIKKVTIDFTRGEAGIEDARQQIQAEVNKIWPGLRVELKQAAMYSVDIKLVPETK